MLAAENRVGDHHEIVLDQNLTRRQRLRPEIDRMGFGCVGVYVPRARVCAWGMGAVWVQYGWGGATAPPPSQTPTSALPYQRPAPLAAGPYRRAP